MSENKTTNTLQKIEFPPSLDNALHNLTDEPTRRIGKTLADIWDLVFGWLSHIDEKRNIKYQYAVSAFEREVSDSISKIPEDKRMEPSIHITAQALENSKYCIGEPELRRMFTSLICRSMNSDYSNLVHPSFAEIIKQMSVLDARTIRLFKGKDGKFVRLPVCKCILQIPDSSSCIDLPEHIFLELPDTDFLLGSLSVSSLSRLGLLTVTYDKKLDTPHLYDKFFQHQVYEYAKNIPFTQVQMLEGVVEATPLGNSFLKVCVPD